MAVAKKYRPSVAELKQLMHKHELWLANMYDEEEAAQLDLRGMDLTHRKLQAKDLRHAKFYGADLRYADLSGSNLQCADLQYTNLTQAKLRTANLSYAYLCGATMYGTHLGDAVMLQTNLSGAKDLLSASDYIKRTFQSTSEGVVVYKTFGTYHAPVDSWGIQEGSIIEEEVNPNRTETCGCGVNVATLGWVLNNCSSVRDIWECLIKWEDLADVVVPYNTDGKIRARRVTLVRVAQKGDR